MIFKIGAGRVYTNPGNYRAYSMLLGDIARNIARDMHERPEIGFIAVNFAIDKFRFIIESVDYHGDYPSHTIHQLAIQFSYNFSLNDLTGDESISDELLKLNDDQVYDLLKSL